MTKKFGDWLSAKLVEANMSAADLSRATGKDSAVISNLINNKRTQPSVESCKLIAKALNIPLEEVYRAANILPADTDIDTVSETVLNLMKDLQVEDRKDILEYARLRHKLATEREQYNVSPNTKRHDRRTAPT